MPDKNKIISQVLVIANKTGLTDITPNILSESGNLIIHLSPHSVVARVATYVSKENPKKSSMLLARELRVAEHLKNWGVPVVSPINFASAGPYDLGGIWMTFWNYITPTKLNLSASEAIRLLSNLTIAMKDFSDKLPVLGVWERVKMSAERLNKDSDLNIKPLVDLFYRTDHQMRIIEPTHLWPAHGDAHSRNLVPSTEGWLWTDFEDASLMPKYWDVASFVANLVLFKGFKHPVFDYLLNQTSIINDLKSFEFALTARLLMSVLGNVDLAQQGFGDLKFAMQQLKLVNNFFPLTL